MASFTSQAGDYLTRSAELVFGLPDDLNYSKNGMIYGARLLESTRSLRISDPEFAANFDEHVRQCVFYDLLLGRYSMKELSESDRSEEHTSELQSLMRISYAVFCLKKKTSIKKI